MQNIIFTQYQNVKDTSGEQKNMPWSAWCDVFLRHAVRGSPSDTHDKKTLEREKNGPAIILGEVEGPRRASSVRRIHALALDLEGLDDGRLVEILDRISPFTWALYSTHKHGAACVHHGTRLRVILPLAEPIPPERFFGVWDALQELVGGANDPATRDLARLHFLPSTFDPLVTLAYVNEGEPWTPPMAAGSTASRVILTTTVTTPSRPVEEIELLVQSKTRILPADDEIKNLVKKLLAGETLAEPGERHSKILKITFWLAAKLGPLNKSDLGALFAKSISKMTSPDPITATEVWTAYQGALTRITEDKKTTHTTKTPQTSPYTEDELQAIATKQGWTPEALTDKWLIQKDGAVWLLNSKGEYEGAYSKDDAPIAVRKILARAPIQIWTITQNGYKYKTPGELVAEHGTLASKIVTSLAAQYTAYDSETGILTEAAARLRNLPAVFHTDVDGWLKSFGDVYLKLSDWLSCAPDLTKNLCAIYLDGKKEVGKTLFALGVARLWTTGSCAEIDQVLGGFNEELTRCPLVFIDEQMPRVVSGQSTSGKLRALLGNKTRSLKRKYRSNTDLVGAIRLVLAANNENLLDEMEAKSTDDLDAIAQRFLYVRASDEPIEYLNRFSKTQLEKWAQHAIAEHCLWLSENHKVVLPGKRFWVEGIMSTTHELLLTNNRWTSLVCEWLIRYLLNPRPLHADAAANGLVRIEKSQLLVNEQAVADKWALYLTNTRQDPVVKEISGALKSMSLPERKQLRWARHHVRYHQVITDHLLAWSEKNGIGDPQLLADRISGALPMDLGAEREPGDDSDTDEKFNVF
jgi:hypothetical protein